MPFSPEVGRILDTGLFDRLPATFATYTYDRLREWDLLFPAEQNYFERLLGLLGRSSSEAVAKLFADLVAVEEKMEVSRKVWNTRGFDLGHVDFLQRSPYYAQWRQAIAKAFAVVDPLLEQEQARKGRPRAVIILSPPELPTDPARMWKRVDSKGKRIALSLNAEAPAETFLPLLLAGAGSTPSHHLAESDFSEPYASWYVAAKHSPKLAPPAVSLAFEDLAAYRTTLMGDVRAMLERKQIKGPRELGAELKNLKVAPPPGRLGEDPLLASFTRSVLLAGNGTLLINNTFAEWAATQAIRRARPRLLIVEFGVRNKIKPFSSLLIFSDQETTTPIPTQQDTLGTYVDLEVFYEYLWRECEKYPEYRNNTVYLFAGIGMEEALLLSPPDFPLFAAQEPVTLPAIHSSLREWLGV